MRKILIFGLIALSIGAFAQKRNVSLSDIWASGAFYPKTISGFVNLNDGKSYCVQSTDEKGNTTVEQYDYLTGEKKGLIIDGAKVATALKVDKFNFSSFTLSNDETKAVLEYDVENIYRHSTRSKVIIVTLKDYATIKLSDKKVRYPEMDPSGTKVAYVSENNLYIMDLLKGKTKQVTKDGEWNSIINGAVDWVYEEEFSMSQGYQWNVDGSKIAYYRFDESAVKEWQMTMYGDLYPEQYKYKYPKAGEANSIVEVHICDVNKGRSKKLELGSENDQYLPRIKWTKNPNLLSIQRLNRLQNKWELLMANLDEGNVFTALEETDEQYVDVTDDIYFLKDNRHMIVASASSGFKHLYFHKVEGPQVFQITKGKWEVDQVLAVDQENELIYFTSTEASPLERPIYVIDFQGKTKKKLTTEQGTHSANFSKDFSLALHKISNVSGIEYVIRSSADWSNVRTVEDNASFKEGLKEFNLSTIDFSSFKTERGDELNYYMIKPQQMDSGKQYPMLMYVYGGPGSQTVTNSYLYNNYYWYQMLANEMGVIVVSVDNRGTGARGEEFKKVTYKQLGKLETEDQISAAKYFGKLDYVDAARIGIWGWSYGGYMSSLCLAKGNDVFKMAIAVAPVSNWRYYDNIYTERYMQRPIDNADGYDNNSPINFVKDIKGPFLIIHGTGDDNVHFQNSVEMVDAMIENNIPFDAEYYPNKNHGIYGGYTRLHLYNKMTKFISENL